MNGKPVICGGLDAGYNARDECHILKGNNGFSHFATMSTPRYWAASVVYNNHILVSGGYDGFNNFLKSSEYLMTEGTVA